MTRRKDGRWQDDIVIGGKRRFFYGKTKAEVLRKIREYEEKQERGMLFKDVANEWEESHFPSLVPSTAKGYMPGLKRCIAEFGDIPIKDVTAGQVNVFLKDLAAKGYGKKVVATQKNILNMIFNFAMVSGYAEQNVCIPVSLPSGLHSKRRELPTEHEIDVVKKSDWLFPFFLLYTGCRRGEALAVTYEDIDWERKIIHINKAVGYEYSKPYIKTTKTEAGNRDVVLLDALAERLKNGSGLIFKNDNGDIFTDTQITRKWTKWQKENKVAVTAHQLRHGYATLLHDAGLDVKDAQYLLGHSTVAMTQDIYTHIRQQRQRENAAKLNDYVNMM